MFKILSFLETSFSLNGLGSTGMAPPAFPAAKGLKSVGVGLSAVLIALIVSISSGGQRSRDQIFVLLADDADGPASPDRHPGPLPRDLGCATTPGYI